MVAYFENISSHPSGFLFSPLFSPLLTKAFTLETPVPFFPLFSSPKGQRQKGFDSPVSGSFPSSYSTSPGPPSRPLLHSLLVVCMLCELEYRVTLLHIDVHLLKRLAVACMCYWLLVDTKREFINLFPGSGVFSIYMCLLLYQHLALQLLDVCSRSQLRQCEASTSTFCCWSFVC